MTNPVFGSWEYWHQKRKAQKAAKPTVPQIDYSTTSHECPNGILGTDSNGFVQLFIVENVRKQLTATARPELVDLANSLPHFWAFDDAIDVLADQLTDDQKFQIHANCSREDTLQGTNMGWTPAVQCKPDESHKAGWLQGDVIPDAGALAHHIDWQDLGPLVATWVKRSALSL